MQADTGEAPAVPFECYWDPNAEDAAQQVAVAAAAQATVNSHPDAKQRTPYIGISATLVGA